VELEERPVAPPAVLGREEELAAVAAFVTGQGEARGLVLRGEAGMGKTTLWQEALAAARQKDVHVLAARASEAELRLPFVALADLLEEVQLASVPNLPPPQQRALEVALFRTEREQSEVSIPVAAGFTAVLRGLTARERVLVAVDDVPWLDRASAEALSFAARRLAGSDVRFLLARRPVAATELEAAFDPPGVTSLDIGPLSLGAIRTLLVQRLDLTLPRPVLRRVFDATGGNPLFAIEVGRLLRERGIPETGAELPVPDSVADVFGPRVAELPGSQRRALLAVALSPALARQQLAAVADAPAIEDAFRANLLVLDGTRVRVSHPLLAAEARKHATTSERQELHLALAETVADATLRVQHLAVATELPDEDLAGAAGIAAREASARGAWHDAVALADHALRLSPPDSPDRPERVLALAGCLAQACEERRLTDLLQKALPSLPAGAMRARAYQLLTEGVIETSDEIRSLLERAREERHDDLDLHATVLALLAEDTAVIRVEQLPEVETAMANMLKELGAAAVTAKRAVLLTLAWARSLHGHAIDELCEQFDAAVDSTSAISHSTCTISNSPRRIAGQRLVWRGEVDRARELLSGLLRVADERGEAYSYALVRLHLCELELRIGQCGAAGRLLEEWAESSERIPWPMYERCRALLAATTGRAGEAEQWAARAIQSAEAAGVRWDLLEALRARGLAALARDPARAAASFREVWEHTRREGVDDPGAFPAAPDLVEALVVSGDIDEARAVATSLAELAEGRDHPWGLASAMRCQAMVSLATDYDEYGVGLLLDAADSYAECGLRFDQARSLLFLGRARRRYRKWAAARRSLGEAAEIFDELEAEGWAAQARAELERTGGRRPASAGELTPTERRVAELAAAGSSNKQIAAELVVSVYTVQKHLSHVYAKLGVRSRTQLAPAVLR
jgi:DNA-binding CsgD family transcriptional regulator